MDRIRDIRPPGSPHLAYASAPQVVQRLLASAVAGPNGCLIWTGQTDYQNYGKAKIGKKTVKAHRAIYQLMVGPVQSPAVVDHACHNRDESCAGGDTCLHRRCINPHHLDKVTQRENQLRSPHSIGGQNVRKTHCPQGHAYDEANTRITPAGRRSCRECSRIRCRSYQQRLRAERPTPVDHDANATAPVLLARAAVDYAHAHPVQLTDEDPAQGNSTGGRH